MNDKNVKQVRRSIPVKYHHMVGCNISVSSWTAVPREITTGFVLFSEDINFRPKCLSVQFAMSFIPSIKMKTQKKKNLSEQMLRLSCRIRQSTLQMIKRPVNYLISIVSSRQKCNLRNHRNQQKQLSLSLIMIWMKTLRWLPNQSQPSVDKLSPPQRNTTEHNQISRQGGLSCL